MYNGIGLPTARGSGTNGYVQRNWAAVRKTKDKVNYKTEQELEKLDAANNKQPNKEILDHERKRKVEIKCIEYEEILEEQGWSQADIDTKVASYRTSLLGNDGKVDELPRDEFGRVIGHWYWPFEQYTYSILASATGHSSCKDITSIEVPT